MAVVEQRSVIQLAEDSGLFSINPSDLVCETSSAGASYYDYVISCSDVGTSKREGCHLYLAKFDSRVNLEEFQTVAVPGTLFEEGFPENDLALMTLAVLTWRNEIAKSRILCLVRDMPLDCTAALEALKRATSKFQSLHHVQTTSRRNSNASNSSRGSSRSNHSEGMRMRVLLCQIQTVLDEIPPQAVRETKALLNPAGNLLVCICFNFPSW